MCVRKDTCAPQRTNCPRVSLWWYRFCRHGGVIHRLFRHLVRALISELFLHQCRVSVKPR